MAEIVRKGYLADKIVIVDGQPGCGKTMLSPIIASLDRVEVLSYAYEIEFACSLYKLGKITPDALKALIGLYTDLKLYNLMMSRDANFRFADLSSVWRDHNVWRYIKRLWQKGDEYIPAQLEEEKPILNLTTHNLLPMAQGLFEQLGQRVLLIEVVRHPLYMIKQQTLNYERLIGDVRDFTIYFEYKDQQIPFFADGWQDLYLKSNAVERSIYSIHDLTKRAEIIREQYSSQVLTIPFEEYVLNPYGYMDEIVKRLETRMITPTYQMMKKQRVPRQRIADGLALKIYKRCGWQPANIESSEKDELISRREYASKYASNEAMKILDNLSQTYEKKYWKPKG